MMGEYRRVKNGDRCKKCRFHGSAYTSAEGRTFCYGYEYIIATGKSKVMQVYERLGVGEMTEEAARLLEPRNCPFFEPGKRKLQNQPKIARKAWDRELAFALWQKGKTDREIAVNFGVSPEAIRSWRNRNGYKCNREQGEVRKCEPALRAMVEAGMTDAEIGARLGISREAAAWRRNKLGIKRREVIGK